MKSALSIGRVMMVWFIVLSTLSFAANIGDIITNTATAEYTFNNVDKNVTSNEVALTVEGSTASIMLLTPGIGGTTQLLGAGSYLGNDGLYHSLSAPVMPDGTTLSTTTPTSMTDATAYNLNDIAIIQVTDADRNLNGTLRDALEVNVTSPSGDQETIRLIETDVNSGVFTSYIPLTVNSSTVGDGVLYVQSGETLGVTYIDNRNITKADSVTIMNNADLQLWVEKQVNKDIAGIGEILMYTLVVHNDEGYVLNNVVIDDYLPLGLKYKEDTAKIGPTPTTPRMSADGKHLYVDIPALAAKSTETVTFIAQIGAGVQKGEVLNQATVGVVGNTYQSKVASARTIVQEELMRSHGIILGQVYECAYEGNRLGHGVAGVTLYTDNGTYVVTDKNGKFHIEGVEAGTHVIQVDEDVLPDGYVMGTHAQNARFAGRNFSQFVDVGQGALKRVDFCVNRTTKVKENDNATKAQSDVADIYDYVIPTAVEKMPKYNSSHIRQLQGKTEILWPPEGYIPEIPSTRIAIVHDKSQKAEVWLNDQKVSMLNYDGRTTDANSTTVIDKYNGVDLLGQTNTIQVKLLDKSGNIVQTLTRTLHVSTTPAKVEYVEKSSYIIADGKHSPVLAVRFLDENSYPLRSGITGTFSIEAPYASQQALDQLQENPLATAATENRYTIHSDGTAYIKLQPTTKSGQVTLHFTMQNRDEVVTAWLKPKLRDWIMVGFAEGTVGYNTLSGHKESLAAKGAKDKVVKEGRVSFFAKGRIQGKWLLTMAYDSGKDTKNARFFDEIDPNTYYTLYNDGSIQNYEAASRKKLFLKIERDEFSILFGDFTTDLTYTQLSEYSRTMTGIKSEYHTDNVEAKAFIADTDQLFMRDEIRGDGTSGYYHLKNKNVVLNSEHISIEIRDRYQPQRIIETRVLQRFRDYEIDYYRGTLYFRDPVYSIDEQFNPQYIIAEYEMKGDGARHYTYGGRAAFKTLKGALQVGGSFISEDTGSKQSKLMGADTTVKLGANTVFKAEYARTKTTQDGNTTTTADAKLAEIEHVSEGLYARAYYREQDGAFGLGQLNQNLGATRQIGLDVNKVFENRLSIIGKAYRNSDLLTNKDQDVFETRAQIDQTLWSAFVGFRYANSTDTASVQQMLVGASYAFFDQKLKLHATHDQSFGKDEDLLFPTKTVVGADYALNAQVNLFANYEWARGDAENHDLSRVGLRYQPWMGMTMENATLSEFVNDSSRVYNTLGMLQNYQLNANWSLNVGYEKGDIINQKGEVIENNTTGENVNFNAYRLGVNYHTVTWTAMLNGEYRDAVDEQKYNVTAGVYSQTNEALALALSAGYSKFEDLVNMQEDANIRFSAAYRPEDTDIILLNKLDLVHSKRYDDTEKLITQKVINNFNFNYSPTTDFEISLQYGMKYVIDTVEEYEYKGFTQLFGIDTHYDITEVWEIGMQGSVLYAHSANNWDYGFGLYTGYNIFENMMLIAGYNWEGFEDTDFSLQTYRIEGPYMQFRMKVDQKSLKDLVRFMSW